ncbi:MAG: DNA-directed RNA polymerase subunit N [Candidatus Methanomethylicia archaeon]|uniref:DNA-directed RNA polymerase subunit Rpo10 n=1 Tax=Candidatus Methanomethylicus mesodigestus TaxID=1867258 RepID=A0A7C3J285_9CREN|nr:DNA-directed RNA polymerase subunit N [Candidatus Methanomethylicia archaeon]
MIIPVRCFTCGKVIADKWDEFKAEVAKGENPAKVLDSLGIKRYCCRRMFLSHIELLEESLKFSVQAAEEGKI